MSLATPGLPCPETRQLHQFLAGDIGEVEAQVLEVHLQACLRCVARLADAKAADALLDEVRRCGADGADADDPPSVARLIQHLRRRPEALRPAGQPTAEAGRPTTVAGSRLPNMSSPLSADDLTPEEADPAPPGRNGRYRVVRRLGAGGMGTVYLAEDPNLRRPVAIKVPRLAASLENRTAARQRFLREARAAAAVRHAHICPIHDVGEQTGTPFVVMSYIEGETLSERLKRDGRFADPRAAVALAVQIAEGLAAIHAKGIIHRDLKPGNVLIDRHGAAYVTDFGLARWEDDAEQLTTEGAVMGTPPYMAPEQATGGQVFGPPTSRTDVYSLGTMLYQMLTGSTPFGERSSASVLYCIIHEDPPPPRQRRADLDPALEAIVLKAMARRPEDRYADGGELAAALDCWQQGAADQAPTLTLPPPAPARPDIEPAPRSTRSRWRRWSWRLGAALAACALLGILVIQYFHRPISDEETTKDLAQAPGNLQPPDPANPQPQKSFKGWIDVRIWKDHTNEHVWLGHEDALPLRIEDRFRVVADINQPAFVYVIWINTKGQAIPIYPWDSHWNYPENEDRTSKLDLPSKIPDWGISKDDVPGMETLLLLVREKPWDRTKDIRLLVSGLRPVPMQNRNSAVWFENWNVVHDEERGPDRSQEAENDALMEMLRTLAERLKSEFVFMRAVSFANAGGK